MEAHGRAAPVIDRSKIDERGLGYAAAITLAPQPSAARHLDLEPIGESIDDADADAVQAAGGPVCITTELAPGVQGRQDDLEGRFVGKTRMRIDRDTPAVVADCDPVLNRKLDFDTRSMPGDALPYGAVKGLSVPRSGDPLELRCHASASGGDPRRGASPFPWGPRRLSVSRA